MEDYGQRSIILTGGKAKHITHQPDYAYMVAEGSVMISIVPWNAAANEPAGIPIPLCDVQDGRIFPAFSYTDREHRSWRMSVSANGEATLIKSRLPAHKAERLHSSFAKRAALSDYDREGFEECLAGYYRMKSTKENVYIKRSEIYREEDARKSAKTIVSALKSEDDGPYVVTEGKGDLVYAALKIVCKKQGIPIAREEEVRKLCGRTSKIEDVARISHFSYREITLEKDWFHSDCGPVVGFTDKGRKPVVCMQKSLHGSDYYITYLETNETKRLTSAEAAKISPKAYSIYSSFPKKPMELRDILSFGLKFLNTKDIVMLVALTLAGTLIGILEPMLNQKIYDEYIPLGNNALLIQICSVIAAFMIGNVFFSIVKSLCAFRLSSRISVRLQVATYDRLFNLPETFFRKYDSADLAMRIMSVDDTANSFFNVFFVTFLSSALSLIYLLRMFKYAKKLSWIALGMILLYGIIVFWISARTMKHDKKIQTLRGVANSKLYQYINGIEKIRMSGAEDRALYEYLQPFIDVRRTEKKKGSLLAAGETLSGVATTLFSIVFYYLVINKKMEITAGSFIAFNSAFGVLSSGIFQIFSGLTTLRGLRPSYERVKEVMETLPEAATAASTIDTLTGEIELRNVSFTYAPELDNVLNNVSFKIHSGEYIGIVGPSGCGKSTLLKLLLGFEAPQTGAVIYDGNDLAGVDKQALRKRLGVVLQNGKLISGSIFENITIAAPRATQKQVEAVVRAVGLEKDVQEMPMGLHTMLSEDSGSISGGQKQRILIARSIINEPAVLFLDEATSALDNVTQSIVCNSLDGMRMTRVAIAHRLSTIQSCDRILVLNGGVLVEQGSYDELMAKRGLFYEMAIRQIA